MFRANFCPSSVAQDLDFLQHMVQYPVMWYAGVWHYVNVVCPKHVELILEINKTVIVAYSWSSIFTLPTLMMHGQTQIKVDSTYVGG
jgi:hypothetical protein